MARTKRVHGRIPGQMGNTHRSIHHPMVRAPIVFDYPMSFFFILRFVKKIKKGC